MRLYSGSSVDFIGDSTHNRIADRLKDAFLQNYRRQASPGEVNSWRNSLRAISQVFDAAKLHDHGVILEYELPLSSKRLDCIITGRDSLLNDQAVIVELKQWEKCEEGDGDKVVTFVGGGHREMLHPSVQVGRYKEYLEDSHTAFHEGDNPVGLGACSYLHNYSFSLKDPVQDTKFEPYSSICPLFSADDVPQLMDFIRAKVGSGQGHFGLNRLLKSRYRAGKKLLQHVGKIVEGKSEYILLDEQLVAFNRVLAEAKAGHQNKKKSVVVVRGGPGTGKSVIALNLLAELSKAELNTHYVTGSKAFTSSLQKIVGRRAAQQLKYTDGYQKAEYNEIDVMVVDEAHRIRTKTYNRFRPFKTDKSQLQELISASKVSVFFIDDKQVVRPKEIGSAQMILDEAENQGLKVFDYKLETQFRCNGSDGFINWVNNTLEIERTPNILWNLDDSFEFRIVDSPEELEAKIKMKAEEGYTARVTAGFCWPWSEPLTDGTLANDVVIGEFQRPWNAKSASKRKIAKGIPPESLWAYDPNGIHQVGCVYTAQGFEFDYVGIIFGLDLVYRHSEGWKGDSKNSFDGEAKKAKEKFIDLVKNTYRVLLTRGMKGCYVYFADKQTEEFFRSRTEKGWGVTETPTQNEVISNILPFEWVTPGESERFTTCVPVYDLKIAAGFFSETQVPEPEGWAKLKSKRILLQDYFVAQVTGKSMEPKIPDGSWCLFSRKVEGSRNGRHLVVQHQDISDPETGGSYTLKTYRRMPRDLEEGEERGGIIVLDPINKSFKPIALEENDEVHVVAELVEVLR